jgi:hypothetical protein
MLKFAVIFGLILTFSKKVKVGFSYCPPPHKMGGKGLGMGSMWENGVKNPFFLPSQWEIGKNQIVQNG